jgi:hypothetical protein
MKTIQLPFDIALAPITHLKAGTVTCIYEEGKVRYIKQKQCFLSLLQKATISNFPYRLLFPFLILTWRHFHYGFVLPCEIGETIKARFKTCISYRII